MFTIVIRKLNLNYKIKVLTELINIFNIIYCPYMLYKSI